MTVQEEESTTAWGGADTSDVVRLVALYAALSVVVGALGGLFWRLVVDLPAYRVQEGGKAVIAEEDLSAMFSLDSWFVITGAILGAALGWCAWRWFRPLGWRLSVIGAAGALVAATACWGFSLVLAPAPFKDRLSSAAPGDLVPVDFTLHAPIAVLVWAAAAMVPILLAASFSPDPDDATSGSAADRRNARARDAHEVGR